jgi:hypothetical protein
MPRLIALSLCALAALSTPAHAAKWSLRHGKLADWISNVTHPCHFPLKKHKFDASKWKLTWSDEFNGSDGSACFTKPAQCAYMPYAGIRDCPAEFQGNLKNLDKCKWSVYHFKNYMYQADHDFSAEDVTVENGMLVLTSRARPKGSVLPAGGGVTECKSSQAWSANCALSAGGLESRPYPGQLPGFMQQYGRFEVRAKLPHTPGSWPAHWLMPGEGTKGWPGDGEIDIMESFGGNTKRVALTVHWEDKVHESDGWGCALNTAKDFGDEFHIFAIEWDESEIRWFVDDYLVGTERAKDKNKDKSQIQIPKHPFYWILNTSISPMGMKDPSQLDPDKFPVGKHYIDYVRVYTRK